MSLPRVSTGDHFCGRGVARPPPCSAQQLCFNPARSLRLGLGSIYIQYFWPELLFAFPFSTSSVVWDLLAFVGLRVVGIGFLLWFLVRPPLLGVRCLAFGFVVSDMVGRMRLGEDETANIDTVKGRGPRPAHSNPGCCAQSTW